MDAVLRTHTLPQALALLDSICRVPYRAKRTWKNLLSFLGTLDPETQKTIYDTFTARVGSKRKAVTQKAGESREAKKARVLRPTTSQPGPSQQHKIQTVDDLIEGPFLRTQDEGTIERCITKFIDRTNNQTLQKKTCVVCARRLFAKNIQILALTDIPNRHVLKPTHGHPSHVLVDGALFHSTVDINGLNPVCDTCVRELVKCNMPKLSLANNMWVGDIPFQLSILTLPEQLLVSLYFPVAYIFKIYPKNVRPRGDYEADATLPFTTEKLRGNVSTFRLPTTEIAHMVAGQLVPRPSLLLAAVIGVTFIGVNRTALKHMPGMLRKKIFEALPEDDIPTEILENISLSSDVDAVGREHAGYVPNPDTDGEEGSANDEGFSDPTEIDTQDGDPLDDHSPDEPFTSASEDGPPVFPLQTHGVLDIGGDNIPDDTLFSHAVENAKHLSTNTLASTKNHERFDGGATNPNHLLGAFPMLFPYGYGGFEVDRERKVTYEEHVKWALQYHDLRFRKHTSFAFQAFGVLLKRQVCRSAKLQMDRNQFLANQTAFKLLTPKDFLKANEDELAGRSISNPTIRLLRKHISTVRARVQGTDESRVSIRAQIWGMTIKYNPPTLWLTINLSDTNDPIAQVLAGQAIDLDNFVAKTGPNATMRGNVMSADPFAAAEYFHLVIGILLDEMIGINVGVHGAINRKEGIFGLVNGYIGTVEAQARGSLHLHILFWLKDAPTSSLMQQALQSEKFRSKIKAFIKNNIRADVAGDILPQQARTRGRAGVSYSRPIDPRKEGYHEKILRSESHNAAILQSHECTIYYCLKSVKGGIACKRGYPWLTYPDDWVDAEGNWGPRRRYPFLNPWNPPISRVTRCNMDIKLLTNACETKDIGFYITLYITKKQVQAANASAVLAQSRAFLQDDKPANTTRTIGNKEELRKINLRLLEQCANTLSRQYEMSGPEVMSYLMGWGDRYISHTFIKIYWDSMVASLYRAFPSLKLMDRSDGDPTDHPQSESRPIVLENGSFTLQDQLGQYADRGIELESMNLYDFFLSTYHVSPTTDISDQHPPAGKGLELFEESDKKRRFISWASGSLVTMI
ncbi:ATP-dependent DNA helicase [Mycena indigotica]|uniref:ATP-dependent DNA helicase n=1 Tax=Mycena indigotica TaxID=2126181 RepID=A0A8H6W3H4_9AGAR|nr:ATP-dependent DNA helicase [Mycena indigotica]KAF7301576.1 ATP-dependent DNA helicase [Mycena indigotica]